MLRQIEAPLKLVIAGSYDFTLHESAFKQKIAEVNRIAQESLDDQIKAEFGDFGEAQRLLQDAKDEGIIYLEEDPHQFVLVNGASLKVYASLYTVSSNADWGFQREDAHNFNIEDDTDIAITHGPPHGVMDITTKKPESTARIFSQLSPKLSYCCIVLDMSMMAGEPSCLPGGHKSVKALHISET